MEDSFKPFHGPAEVLKVLGHPARLCILHRIMENEGCNVTFMQNCMGLPQSTLSMHLMKLRSSGIITGERSGLEVHYYLKNRQVGEFLKVLFAEQQTKQ